MSKISNKSLYLSVLLSGALAPLVANAQYVPSVPEQISVGVNTTSPDGRSSEAVAAPNANLTVFSSEASNLVSGDGNQVEDIFARDASGKISRISVSVAGGNANGRSKDPAVTQVEPNGNYGVAFSSSATNLTDLGGGQANAPAQVYLRIPHLQKTILVSRGFNADGTVGSGDGDSKRPSVVSVEGGAKFIVAFESRATNLAPPYIPPTGANQAPLSRIYFAFIDPNVGVVKLKVFSRNDLGVEADGDLREPMLSGFGDSMVFLTNSTNFGWANGQGHDQVAFATRATGKTMLISKNSNGDGGNGDSSRPSVSFNGSRMAFRTVASDILGASTSSPALVAYFREIDSLFLAGADENGSKGNGTDTPGKSSIRLDPRGRFAVLTDDSANYVSGDTPNTYDIFIKDFMTGKILRVNTTVTGAAANGDSFGAVMGGLGYNSRTATVAFESHASNLATSGSGTQGEVYQVKLVFPAPPLLPDTKIETPPDIARKTRRLDLVLQEFDGDVLVGSMSGERVHAAAIKITYDIRLHRSGTKKGIRLTSSRNRIAVRNLTPGKYTTKYRVKGTYPDGSTFVTSYSPISTVTVAG